MARGRDTISQRIALEGTEEIKRQLAELGVTGEKAVQQIKTAADRGSAGLSILSSTSQKIQESFTALGTIFDKIGTAAGKVKNNFDSLESAVGKTIFRVSLFAGGVAAAGFAVVSLARSSVDYVDTLSDLSKGLGVTTDALQLYQQLAINAGISSEKLNKHLETLAKRVEEAGSSRDEAIAKIGQIIIGSEKVGVATVLAGGRAQEAIDKVNDTLRHTGPQFIELAKNTKPFDDAARRLLTLLKEAGADAGKTVQSLSADLQRAAQEGRTTAQEINDLLVKAGSAPEATNIGERLRRTLTGAQDIFAKEGIKIQDNITGELLTLEQVLPNIAAKFAGMEDGIKKTALASKFFARDASKMLVLLDDINNSADNGAAAIAKFLRIDPEDQKAAAQFETAFTRLETVFTRAKAILGIEIGKALVPAFESLTKVIIDNRAEISAWAQDIGNRLTGVILDFIAVMNGAKNVSNQWIVDIRDAFISMKEGIVAAWPALLATFKAVMATFQSLATIVNSVLGTQLTGSSLALITVFGTLSGALGVVIAGFSLFISVAGLVVASIAAIGVVPTAIILAFVALGAFFVIFWSDIKKGFFLLVNDVKTAVTGLANFFFTIFVQPFLDLGNFVREVFNGIIETIGRGIQRILEFLGLVDRVSTTTGNAVGAASGEALGQILAGGARGGHVRGPGSTTSDSIFARVSNDEFIIRAKAVHKYGLGFLHRLNNMQLPKFASGGLIGGPGNPFGNLFGNSFTPHAIRWNEVARLISDQATLVGTPQRTTSINLIVAGESFQLTAPKNIAEALGRHARSVGLRSAGKRPSWNGT